MTAPSDHITEITDLAYVGWSYNDGETEVMVAWPRGTTTLILGLRALPDGPWRNAGTLDRKRWSIQARVESARARAHQFLQLAEQSAA